MALTIDSFKNEFKGGVRANLFSCSISSDWLEAHGQAPVQFFVKGTSIPASTVGNIDVPYQGRQLKVPGDRTYADWTATLFNDPGMIIHGKFINWMSAIQHHARNYQATYDIYGTGTVTQFHRDGNPLASFEIDMYPTELAAIDVAWDSNDAVEEYAVTFAVNHWEPIAGAGSGSSSGSGPFRGSANVSIDESGKIKGSVGGSYKLGG